MVEIRKQKNIDSFIWNTIGGIVSASASIILLLLVTRTVGAKEGGIFSLAFATAQILLTVGKYGVRSFQVTDVKEELSKGTYFQSRIWLCGFMLLLSVIYVWVVGYDIRKSCIFVAVCGIKVADAVEDVFHGRLQQKGQLARAGMLLAIRNIITMLTFGLGMVLIRDLLKVCVGVAIISNVFALGANWIALKKHETIEWETDKEQIKSLLIKCFPLFFGHFLSLYIYNVPKYVIDFTRTEEEITYYSIIFMPAFAINLCSEFIFKPLLPTLASIWVEGKKDAFYNLVKNFLLIVCAITLCGVVCAYLFGTQILSLFYAVDVVPYRVEMAILMLSGGFSAAVYLLYNVLTAMRYQRVIVRNYCVVSMVITVLACIFVAYWGIAGATIAYLIAEVILLGLMLFDTFFGYKKGGR